MKLTANLEKALPSGYIFDSFEPVNVTDLVFRKIFLIDDDEVASFITAEIIEEMGLAEKVETFYNGMEALNYIRNEDDKKAGAARDLILLDINMPEMNGLDFLERYIKLDHAGTATVVVMLTTPLTGEDKQRAHILRDSIDMYVEKPLNKEILSGIVNFISA